MTSRFFHSHCAEQEMVMVSKIDLRRRMGWYASFVWRETGSLTRLHRQSYVFSVVYVAIASCEAEDIACRFRAENNVESKA